MLDQSEGQNISLLIRPRAHISWNHNVAWGWSKNGESFRAPSGPLLPQGYKHYPPSPLLVFQCILRESSFCSSSLNDSGEEKGGSVMLREGVCLWKPQLQPPLCWGRTGGSTHPGQLWPQTWQLKGILSVDSCPMSHSPPLPGAGKGLTQRFPNRFPNRGCTLNSSAQASPHTT